MNIKIFLFLFDILKISSYISQKLYCTFIIFSD